MAKHRDIEPGQIISMLELMDRFTRIRELGHRISDRRPRRRDSGAESAGRPSLWRRLRPRRRAATEAAPRYGFDAKVVIHKNQRYIKGRSLDISRSGLFVAADREVFRANEKVRVSITPSGSGRVYKTIAEVVRFEARPGRPRGYGLKFFTWPGIPHTGNLLKQPA